MSTTDILSTTETPTLPDTHRVGALADLTVRNLLAAVAGSQPTPGGGSAAALAGAVSAALAAMVARHTAGKKGFEPVSARMGALADAADALAGDLAADIDRDAQAYDAVMAAFRLPARTDEDKSLRRSVIQATMKQAAETPLRVAEKSARAAALGREALVSGDPNTGTDAAVAVLLAVTSIEGACLNVAVNLDSIKDGEFVADHGRRLAALLDRAREERAEMWAVLADRIKSLPSQRIEM